MKRVIAVAVALLLCCSAFADSGIDWTKYTDEELIDTINEFQEMVDEASRELSSRHIDSDKRYTLDGIEFTVQFYAYNDNSILIEYDWTNVSSSSKAFQHTVTSQAYQNGKELSDWIIHFGNIDHRDDEKIAPGYGKKSYHYFRLDDESEITILVTDYYHVGNFEKGLVFKVMPEDLAPFRAQAAQATADMGISTQQLLDDFAAYRQRLGLKPYPTNLFEREKAAKYVMMQISDYCTISITQADGQVVDFTAVTQDVEHDNLFTNDVIETFSGLMMVSNPEIDTDNAVGLLTKLIADGEDVTIGGITYQYGSAEMVTKSVTLKARLAE